MNQLIKRTYKTHISPLSTVPDTPDSDDWGFLDFDDHADLELKHEEVVSDWSNVCAALVLDQRSPELSPGLKRFDRVVQREFMKFTNDLVYKKHEMAKDNFSGRRKDCRLIF